MRVLQVPSGFVYATRMTYSEGHKTAPRRHRLTKLRRPATPRVKGATGATGAVDSTGVTRTGVT